MLFNLFKKNDEARPIFAPLGTDMHCHLIPGVDDGSKCMEETLFCLRTLQSVGYRKVIITPHFQYPRFTNDEDDIVQRYAEVCKAATDAGIDIELGGIGGEYRIDNGFRARLDKPRFLTLNDKYILVELSLHHQMAEADDLLFELQMGGKDIIMAHPERYPYLNIDGPRMEMLLNQGVLMQVNILSLGGFYGDEARRRAFAMIERGWVSFLGSDTHNTLYCQALRDLSHSHKIARIVEKHPFLNNTL